MTVTTWPYDTGAGTQITETRWDAMLSALLSDGPIQGVNNGLQAYGDSSGMQVKVKSGRAHVQGKWLDSDADVALAIAANGSGNPRIDRVVLRLDRTGDTMGLAVVTGTPAGSPSAPALTQTTNGIYEVGLATVAVASGASTITAGNVTDGRTYASAKTAAGGTTQNSEAHLASDWTGASATFVDTTLTVSHTVAGPTSVVDVEGVVSCRDDTQNNTSGRVDFGIRVDSGTAQGTVFATGINQVITLKARFTGLAAGVHTFKLQAKYGGVGGPDTVRVYGGLESHIFVTEKLS